MPAKCLKCRKVFETKADQPGTVLSCPYCGGQSLVHWKPVSGFDMLTAAACMLYCVFNWKCVLPLYFYIISGNLFQLWGIITIALCIALAGILVAGVGFFIGRDWALRVGSVAAIFHLVARALYAIFDIVSANRVLPFVVSSIVPAFLLGLAVARRKKQVA